MQIFFQVAGTLALLRCFSPLEKSRETAALIIIFKAHCSWQVCRVAGERSRWQQHCAELRGGRLSSPSTWRLGVPARVQIPPFRQCIQVMSLSLLVSLFLLLLSVFQPHCYQVAREKAKYIKVGLLNKTNCFFQDEEYKWRRGQRQCLGKVSGESICGKHCLKSDSVIVCGFPLFM